MSLKVDEILNKRTLILGEILSNLSRILADLIKQCGDRNLLNDLTVLDFSFDHIAINGVEIWGKVSNYISIPDELNYISVEGVQHPIFKSESSEEACIRAKKNVKLMEEALNIFLKNPTEILFINEVSLYFPFGDFKKLVNVLNSVKTAVLTACYSSFLEKFAENEVVQLQKSMIEALIKYMDKVVYFPPPVNW